MFRLELIYHKKAVCVKSVLRPFPYFDYCSKPVETGDPGPVFLTLPELNAPMQLQISTSHKSGSFRDANISSDGFFSIFDWIFRGNSSSAVQIDQKTQREKINAPASLQTVNETYDQIFVTQDENTSTIPVPRHGLRSIHILKRKMSKVSKKEQEFIPNTWRNLGELNSRKAQFDLGILERRNKAVFGRINRAQQPNVV
uniref:Uncharacterized protein n=1 Tax=Meloidogyne hapla TaxID=6305 RepID=A0A1I8BK60_MELHA